MTDRERIEAEARRLCEEDGQNWDWCDWLTKEVYLIGAAGTPLSKKWRDHQRSKPRNLGLDIAFTKADCP